MGSFFRNLSTGSQRWIVLVTLFSVTLASVPVATKSTASHVAILIPFVLCIGWAAVRVRSRVETLTAAVVTVYGITLAIEIFRGYPKLSHAINDALLVAILVIFGAMLMMSAQTEDERKLRIAAIALAPAVYIAVNVIMHLGHLGPTRLADPGEKALAAGEGASLLKLFGVSTQRIQFPLSLGVNAFGAVAAAGFAAATLLAVYDRAFPRRLTVPLAAVSLYGALASDSRTAILIALVAIALTVVAPRLRSALPTVVLLSLAPLLLVSLVGRLGGSNSLSTLTRGKSGEISTLNGRYYIWKGAWEVAGKLNLHTLIGWGADGQKKSGASLHYAYIFQGSPEPTKYTAHNLILQSILDGGYLSVAVFLVAVLIVLWRLDRVIRMTPRAPVAALRAALLVVLFAGITEALPNYDSDDCLAVLLVSFGTAAALAAPVRDQALARLRKHGYPKRGSLAPAASMSSPLAIISKHRGSEPI